MGIPKIKSATTFRSRLYQTLKQVSKGDSHIITHSQGKSVVLISQEKYNALLDERDTLRKIALGAAEIDAGKGITNNEAMQQLKKLQAKWK